MSIQTPTRPRIAKQAPMTKNKTQHIADQEQAVGEQELMHAQAEMATTDNASAEFSIQPLNNHEGHIADSVAGSGVAYGGSNHTDSLHTDELTSLDVGSSTDMQPSAFAADVMSDWTPLGKTTSADGVLMAQTASDTTVANDSNDDRAGALCAVTNLCSEEAAGWTAVGVAAAAVAVAHDNHDDAAASSSNSNSSSADTTAPNASNVSIASDNAHTGFAEVGDTITLTFTLDEAVNGNPTVTIDGQQAAVQAGSNPNEYIATYTLAIGYTAGSAVAFTIDAVDAAGNNMTTVTAVNDNTAVTLIDTSVVVFDLTTGESSDHSGRTFDAGTTYSIYILVDNGPTANFSMLSQWSHGERLGSDDTIYLVGKSGTIYYNYVVSSAPTNSVINSSAVAGTTLIRTHPTTYTTSTQLALAWRTTHHSVNVASLVATGYLYINSFAQTTVYSRSLNVVSSTALWTAPSTATWATTSNRPQAALFTGQGVWSTQPFA